MCPRSIHSSQYWWICISTLFIHSSISSFLCRVQYFLVFKFSTLSFNLFEPLSHILKYELLFMQGFNFFLYTFVQSYTHFLFVRRCFMDITISTYMFNVAIFSFHALFSLLYVYSIINALIASLTSLHSRSFATYVILHKTLDTNFSISISCYRQCGTGKIFVSNRVKKMMDARF